MSYLDFNWSSEKILIADDDVYTLILFKNILKKVGVPFILTRDGNEALLRLTTDSAITISILDMLMPELTGYQVVKQARIVRPDIIYIAFTADVIRIDKKTCRELGFYTCLHKPILPSKVMETIKESILYREMTTESI